MMLPVFKNLTSVDPLKMEYSTKHFLCVKYVLEPFINISEYAILFFSTCKVIFRRLIVPKKYTPKN